MELDPIISPYLKDQRIWFHVKPECCHPPSFKWCECDAYMISSLYLCRWVSDAMNEPWRIWVNRLQESTGNYNKIRCIFHGIYCIFFSFWAVNMTYYDNIIKWKHFLHYWACVQGIHQSPVNSAHKGQWHGALMFSLICAWTNGWANNHDTSNLRCHHAHYNVTVMY